MENKHYCEIAIDVFFSMKGPIPFDVFIQVADNKLTQIFNKGDPPDKARFETYKTKGATKLYILRKDRRQYMLATEIFLRQLSTQPSPSKEQMSQAIEELTEQALFEIYEDKLFDEKSLRLAQDLAKNYINFVKSDIGVLTQFLRLCHNETYMVRHSITTAIFAILLARAAENATDKMLQIIGLSALLHDVGMACFSKDVNELERQLSPKEWELIKQHPAMGSEIVQKVKDFPPEVKQAIEEHHESYDGRGYPKGLKGSEIYYPARIIAIADAFSALTTRRGGRALFQPEAAVSLMATEGRKYDPQLMAVFEGLLMPRKKKTASSAA